MARLTRYVLEEMGAKATYSRIATCGGNVTLTSSALVVALRRPTRAPHLDRGSELSPKTCVHRYPPANRKAAGVSLQTG